MLCEVGCREGTVLDVLGSEARATHCIESEPEYVAMARSKGHTVVLGKYPEIKPPRECEVMFFWIYGQWNEKLAREVRQEWADGALSPTTTLLLSAEAGEPYEVPSLVTVQRLFGGQFLKVPFDEGDGYRQFGVFLFLAINFNQSAALLPDPIDPMAPHAFAQRRLEHEQHGWRFYPPEEQETRGLGIPSTAFAAVRKLTKDTDFCDLSARKGRLLRHLKGHARSVSGVVDTEEEAIMARRRGVHVTLRSAGIPYNCSTYYVSSNLEYHMKVYNELRGKSRGNLLIVTTLINNARGDVATFWSSHSSRCQLLKVPFDAWNNSTAFVGVTAIIVCPLGNEPAS